MAISLRVYQFQVDVRLPRGFDACKYLCLSPVDHAIREQVMQQN
jgi:hypothetical protein